MLFRSTAKACLYAVQQYREEHEVELPLMLSVTVTDQSGRTLSGQTVEAFWYSVEHARPLSVGLNCALGADQLRPFIEELSDVAEEPVSCYPNAGLPNELGGYDEQPAETAALIHSQYSLDQMAADSGTIVYEILTRLGHRPTRHYYGQ